MRPIHFLAYPTQHGNVLSKAWYSRRMLDLLRSMYRTPRKRLSLEILQQPRAAIFKTQDAQVPLQDPHVDLCALESDPQTQRRSVPLQPSHSDCSLLD